LQLEFADGQVVELELPVAVRSMAPYRTSSAPRLLRDLDLDLSRGPTVGVDDAPGDLAAVLDVDGCLGVAVRPVAAPARLLPVVVRVAVRVRGDARVSGPDGSEPRGAGGVAHCVDAAARPGEVLTRLGPREGGHVDARAADR